MLPVLSQRVPFVYLFLLHLDAQVLLILSILAALVLFSDGLGVVDGLHVIHHMIELHYILLF